ncbi:hypothetical protein IP88_00625 [alpha proteobacterium AAP81b]|nr:hypothetical protein IP88_00625 [alpha proteobacterium AAP81b]
MKKLLGGLVLAVGILVMTVSGLCSAAVLVGFGLNMLGIALFVGGSSFAIGLGLYGFGLHLARNAEDSES